MPLVVVVTWNTPELTEEKLAPLTEVYVPLTVGELTSENAEAEAEDEALNLIVTVVPLTVMLVMEMGLGADDPNVMAGTATVVA